MTVGVACRNGDGDCSIHCARWVPPAVNPGGNGLIITGGDGTFSLVCPFSNPAQFIDSSGKITLVCNKALFNSPAYGLVLTFEYDVGGLPFSGGADVVIDGIIGPPFSDSFTIGPAGHYVKTLHVTLPGALDFPAGGEHNILIEVVLRAFLGATMAGTVTVRPLLPP
jgi:hypothetical protein